MLYQKCSACHSEWNAIKMVIECPFCGNAFEMQTSNFKSVEDTFRYIICTHGFEVIKQKSTFVSLLSDYAPTLEKERRVVKMALESGVYLELMSVSKTDEQEQAAAQAKAINKLNKDYLLDQVWAKQAVLWFVSQLGWTSVEREVHKKIIPAKEVVKQENAAPKQVNKQPDASSVTPKSSGTSSIWMDIRNGVLKKYTGHDWLVTIPEGVTEIAERAFYDNKTVEIIRLPATVNHIRKSAFSYCTKLREITMANGIETIEDWAFLGCTSLQSIVFPSTVKTIGELTFQGCEQLEKVVLSDAICDIPERAFAVCKKLVSVTLPSNLMRVHKEAFADCREIISMTFPSSLLSIEEDAFSGCFSLKNIFVPSKANVHAYAFGRFDHGSRPEVLVSDNPQSILSVPIGTHIQNNTMTVSSMDHIPDSRWSRDKSWESVTKIILGSGITEIKMEAFRGLKDLREVVLPEGLKKIGFSAFADCIKLDNVVIPEGTTTIAAHAFEKCNKLANITIPKSVKYIGDDAFNATAIKSVTVQKDCVICRGNYPIKASAE